MPNYQLSISNIAWHKEDDEAVYTAMQQAGFTGLELAPTRIFSETPYENLTSALLFGGYLKNRWGFSVPSLQSIWYGQQGNIFNAADTEPLLDYTAQAFQFAHSLNCPSLVFGCPKNRMRPLGGSDATAEAFFMQAGNLAARYGVHLALEANPPMYTNYLNNTADAFALVKRLDNPGLSLAEAGKEILAIHELPAGAMEPLTGDRMDDFLEATEQANAIPQPQAWNGIDGLLNGKPFMPEASPADRAAALIELAEKNAPRLGSEERQLIVAYAEAVGDNDKVIGLINRLCEQGYELQKGQMDSFVKSEIESEIAVANAQRQIAQNPAAEPVVTILWSESPHLKDGQQMPLHEAEAVFKELDSARRHDREQPGYTGHWYDKTKFRIDFTMQGQPDSYEGRQDFGDGDGSLIQHIRGYHEYYAQDESWKNHVLHHEGPEAWEADKAQRDMLLHEFVPYMELHCNLAAMEQEARRPLRSGETLTPEQTAYFNAVLDYVKECRPLLNQGQYHLPEPPQLSDFDQSLQDYKKQIEAELEQEAAAAGLTVEEYVASDYEAPAQPNFSIYQVPPGPEGRDFRYRSYEDLQADGLSVDRKNYQLVYTAPLDKDTTLDEIYRRFNIEHPSDYKGHSLSTGDIVVFRQDGKQTAYYVDEGADYRQVPEFFAQPEKQLTPDECMTGEQIQTPRGRFYLTDRSREQMEAAGYGFHHQSEDGRYLIMANGTRAFAIPAQPESHIKTAEMSTEQNYNMIDGMMNNAPSMEELEARAKAGEQISLLDVAEAAKAEAKKPKQTRKTTQKQKKPSIRAQLAAAKGGTEKRSPRRGKNQKKWRYEECISPWKKKT